MNAAPTVVIRAGEMELARYRPSADFSWRVHVPASALVNARRVITMTTDAVFQLSARGHADHREPGLRMLGVTIAR